MKHSKKPYDWVGGLSEKRAELTPERTALKDATTGEEFTYRELDKRANRTARLLKYFGVNDGERVAIVSRNRPELVDLFFGTAKTGGVLAPLSHRLAPRELAELLTDVEPSLIVAEEKYEEFVSETLGELEDGLNASILSLPTGGDYRWDSYENALPEDDSPVKSYEASMDDSHLFLHTGGSTGIPKETVLTHGSILWNSFNTITGWGLRPDDVTPMIFPMFHTGGWNVLTIPFFHIGAKVVIARDFDPGEVLHLVEEENATVLVAVPAVLQMMSNHDDWEETDLSSLRFAKSGGGPCRDAVMRDWWDRGVDLSQGYGLTECGPNNFAMPDDWPEEKAASVGKPMVHVDARIVDEGEELEQGETGELEISSPHSAKKYWRNPEETEEVFGNGWVSTGDLARVDEDGYFHIEGRKKDMYVSGGENVYPSEVENVIAEHPKVEEVVVIGVPDEKWGTVGKAVVKGYESLSLEELKLEEKIAKFKIPKYLEFIDEMPMSGPSKIDREAIKQEFGDK